jgi:hypothetical protein
MLDVTSAVPVSFFVSQIDMDALLQDKTYVVIGWVYPSHLNREEMDLSIQEVDKVLTPRGIIYGLDGSRAYKLIVSKAKAQEAREFLRQARFKIAKVTLLTEDQAF